MGGPRHSRKDSEHTSANPADIRHSGQVPCGPGGGGVGQVRPGSQAGAPPRGLALGPAGAAREGQCNNGGLPQKVRINSVDTHSDFYLIQQHTI